MTQLVRQFEVGAPPERVFSMISIPEKWPQWHINVKRASSNGSKSHWVYGWAGMKVESETEVTKNLQNSVYAFRQIDGFFKSAETRFEIEPGKKGSNVTWTVQYQLPYSYLGKLLDKLKARISVKEGIDESSNKLRELIERR